MNKNAIFLHSAYGRQGIVYDVRIKLAIFSKYFEVYLLDTFQHY